MVNVTTAELAGRRQVLLAYVHFDKKIRALMTACMLPLACSFPLDPPKGKGARCSEGSGIAATTRVPLLSVVGFYNWKHKH